MQIGARDQLQRVIELLLKTLQHFIPAIGRRAVQRPGHQAGPAAVRFFKHARPVRQRAALRNHSVDVPGSKQYREHAEIKQDEKPRHGSTDSR